jgi:anti-anti-sigma factor
VDAAAPLVKRSGLLADGRPVWGVEPGRAIHSVKLGPQGTSFVALSRCVVPDPVAHRRDRGRERAVDVRATQLCPGSSPYVDAIFVELTGEVDIASADEAQAELDRAIWAAPHSEVVVGLAHVTFMDCCGLSVLLRARKSLGDRLILRNPSPPVTRLLDLTNLRDAFRMVNGQA